MFYIKRRIIEIELLNIITAPYITTLSNKRVVVYFRALIRIYDYKAFLDTSIYLVDMIAPPYTEPLWRGIWNTLKKDRKNNKTINIDFIKLYGYPFKPKADKIGFYIVEATERKRKEHALIKPKDSNNKYDAFFSNMYNSYFEGEEYIKEKYPTLKEHNEKDYIKPLLYKLSTSNRIFYYDISAKITLYQYLDLSPITNPEHKEDLKGKPLFYQLVDTRAEMLSKALNIPKSKAIKEVLRNTNFKAQKPKNTKAQ